jgi:hypothetical protein
MAVPKSARTRLLNGVALYVTFVDPVGGTSIRHVIRVVAVLSPGVGHPGLLLWRRGGRGEAFLVAVTIGMIVLICPCVRLPALA